MEPPANWQDEIQETYERRDGVTVILRVLAVVVVLGVAALVAVGLALRWAP